MFGKKATAATMVALATVLGAAGTGVATAEPTPSDAAPPTRHDMKQVLADYREHAGERFQVHGLVYSDAAVWTLVFLTDGPSEFYTINGARAEIAGPGSEAVRQGDVFTGTVTITDRAGANDPVVVLEDVQVIGHQ
ncbi:hypothetical protein [Nocardia sp. NPDC050406]|uniref:hypothetical protein n=1 Tax=Nocardia sp. NPDC050406 TaxID=3364318 RepID=UPI00379FD148